MVTTKFMVHHCFDQQGLGMEAFSILVPDGWLFEGGISWVLDNPAMPAVASFRVKDPRSDLAFEVFPAHQFTYSDNPMLLSMFPPGSRYLGSEVRAPMHAVDALKAIILPRFRGNAPGLKTIQAEELPQLARAVSIQQGLNLDYQYPVSPGMMVTSGRVRISYHGTLSPDVEEDVFGVATQLVLGMPSMFLAGTTTLIWTLDYLFACKAGAGRLDGMAPTFQTIALSFRLNPRWYAALTRLIQALTSAKIQQIQNIGQISRMIHETHEEISDSIMAAYNARQSSQDRVARQFSEYVRGVES
ncbi:MAG: hypothetical protein Q6373_009470, partial [Candidatus Sigynarchaeota archaeon]